MAIRTIVLSVKRQGQVVSWQGERDLASELIDPRLFQDLEQGRGPLFSEGPRTHLPGLQPLHRTRLVPGTSGWIGLDVDNKRILDSQKYAHPFGAPVHQVRSPDTSRPGWGWFEHRAGRQVISSEGMQALDLSCGLCRALAQGKWKSRIEAASAKEPVWKTHPPVAQGQPLEEALVPALRHAMRQVRHHYQDRPGKEGDIFWFQIKPDLPQGWRMFPGLGVYMDDEHNLHSFESLLTILEEKGWGWTESLWPAWAEHARESREVDPAQVLALRAARTQARMERVLPPASPQRPSSPGSRF